MYKIYFNIEKNSNLNLTVITSNIDFSLNQRNFRIYNSKDNVDMLIDTHLNRLAFVPRTFIHMNVAQNESNTFN